MKFDFEAELKALPDKPGVYLMHDKHDQIIYVGKALSLKKRVHQYFNGNYREGLRKQQMIPLIAWFEYIITDSELEALVLECNLIKEHRPKYNVLLRDDKTYPYIKVTTQEEYPRVFLARKMQKDGAKYYGPYTSNAGVKDTIEILQKLYHLRTCNKKLPRDIGLDRPCLNYHMHQCDAPCQGYVSKEDYNAHIQKAVSFLNGNYNELFKELEGRMNEAAAELEFEKAAQIRDLIENVKQVTQKQKITTDLNDQRDVIGLAISGDDAVVQLFFVRDGKLMGRDHFFINVPDNDPKEQVLADFLQQFYGGTPYIPKEILLPAEPEGADMIAEYLSDKKGQRVHLLVPQRGQKEKLLELAGKNAKLILDRDKEKLKREEGRTIGAAKELANLIGIPQLMRMEAFDISNTGGVLSVGSMVVFEHGKPKRTDYRKFRIKTVIGPNDYDSMREVLTRRFEHGQKEDEEEVTSSFTRFPDCIFMDGGLGQVHIAEQVLEDLGLDIPVCGMVKDDHHNTRGLLYKEQEIPLDIHEAPFHLITRLQDEAHRFAITYHKSLRDKNMLHSILDDISGIGPKRRRALMEHFTEIENIQMASLEELMEVPGMDSKSALSVRQFFEEREQNGRNKPVTD